MQMWKRVAVTLEIRERIVGGTPTDPKLIEGWVAANMPDVSADERAKLVDATIAELPKMTEEKAAGMWNTFKADAEGPYIEARQVKAMFKESSNILRDMLIKDEAAAGRKAAKADPEAKIGKSRFTNLKSKVAERLFVEESKIRFVDSKGTPIIKVSGMEERAIHVMTAQGPRTALKRIDYIEAPTLSFTLRYLNDGLADVELIQTLLEHSSWNGLGADRSQGAGMFNVKSVKEL